MALLFFNSYDNSNDHLYIRTLLELRAPLGHHYWTTLIGDYESYISEESVFVTVFECLRSVSRLPDFY